MDTREQKGFEIAQKGRITETPRGWIVPSQSGGGAYLVYKEGMKTICSCPDCEVRQVKCKHIWAVEYTYERKNEQGKTVITKTVKVTYPQDWKNYTLSQNNELGLFRTLLRDLVGSVEKPPQAFGRPRLSLQDQLYCAIQKVYSQLSSRRAHTLYRDAAEAGNVGKAPNYNAINKLLIREDITPILERLLTLSALPLKGVETTFIPDSSGFRTSQFGQYATEKYGLMRKHRWIKAHILTGAKTNVIVSARIGEEHSADSPQFVPLVTDAFQSGFTIKEIPADMGYSSRDNYSLANRIGATAYIPFKKNSTGKSRGSPLWRKAFHYFQLNREEFLAHYHQRSNVESTFNMVKMKFGDRLKSKTFTAQKNELLCKLIAHNIVVLIHEMRCF